MRACGKLWPSEEAASHSKLVLAGSHVPEPCAFGCEDGWHIRKAAAGTRTVKAAARDTGPDRATRALVLARDGHACLCCGRSVVGQVYSLQHRKRRSQGGDNSPCNLITVLGDGTSGCHARIDSRKDPHDAARGYTCQSYEDPATIPVMFTGQDGGFTAWLLQDGGLSFDGPEVGVA